jgi:protein-arginine kinase activator protein McsA
MSRPRLLKNPVALSHCLTYGHDIMKIFADDNFTTMMVGCKKCGMTLEEIRETRLSKEQTKELSDARI